MKEIKFTTKYEPTLSFDDKDFKKKYEERVGNNSDYCQTIDGEKKHFFICLRSVFYTEQSPAPRRLF